MPSFQQKQHVFDMSQEIWSLLHCIAIIPWESQIVLTETWLLRIHSDEPLLTEEFATAHFCHSVIPLFSTKAISYSFVTSQLKGKIGTRAFFNHGFTIVRPGYSWERVSYCSRWAKYSFSSYIIHYCRQIRIVQSRINCNQVLYGTKNTQWKKGLMSVSSKLYCQLTQSMCQL